MNKVRNQETRVMAPDPALSLYNPECMAWPARTPNLVISNLQITYHHYHHHHHHHHHHRWPNLVEQLMELRPPASNWLHFGAPGPSTLGSTFRSVVDEYLQLVNCIYCISSCMESISLPCLKQTPDLVSKHI